MPEDFESIRQQAITRLDAAAAELRSRLAAGQVHQRDWIEDPLGLRTKVGRGHLRVFRESGTGYPGIRYVSSMGANSEDSYSGFLPGVSFDEALLLVYGEWKHHTNRFYA